MFIEMKGAKTQMIVFDHVTKHYKTNIGLDDVSVEIKKGDVPDLKIKKQET